MWKLYWPINFYLVQTFQKEPALNIVLDAGWKTRLEEAWHFIFPSNSLATCPHTELFESWVHQFLNQGFGAGGAGCFIYSTAVLCTLIPPEVKVEALVCFGLWWKHGLWRAKKGKYGERFPQKQKCRNICDRKEIGLGPWPVWAPLFAVLTSECTTIDHRQV